MKRNVPRKPQTVMGKIPPTSVVIALETRLRLVVEIPGGVAGEDLPPDFERGFRGAVASVLYGREMAGLKVISVALEQFEDGGE